MLTKLLLKFLQPFESGNEIVESLPDLPNPNGIRNPLLENGKPISVFHGFFSSSDHGIHYYWRKFDNAYMRPLFGGRGFTPFVDGPPTDQMAV